MVRSSNRPSSGGRKPSKPMGWATLPVLVAVTGTLGAWVSPGCVVHPHHPVVVHEAGPPPWAPAHGQRNKQPKHPKHSKHPNQQGDDAKLVFDTGLGVYLVVDLPDHYFFEGRYFRHHKGGWLVSAKLEGPWVVGKSKDLPPGLRKRDEAKRHGRRKGGPPAKQR